MKVIQGYLLSDEWYSSVHNVVTEEAMKRYLTHWIGTGQSNDTIKLKWHLFERLQNFIRKSIGLAKIKHEFIYENPVEKYHLEEFELSALLSIKPKSETEIWIQDMVRLNIQVGLRINELLDIGYHDFSYNEKYIIIRFHESKGNRGREVVFDKESSWDIFQKYWAMHTPDENAKPLRFRSVSKFNSEIKLLAKRSPIFQKRIRQMSFTGKQQKVEYIERYKLISSHAFRRYAVTKNAKEHGLLLAAAQSGHRQLATIQKHYLKKLRSSDIISMLEKSKEK